MHSLRSMLTSALMSGLALALAGVGLVAVGSPAHAAGLHYGTVDILVTPEAGLLRTRGWVFDDDNAYAPVTLHLYVGGVAGDPNAQFFDLGPTDVARPDVADAYPGAGPNTGFDRTVETSKTGTQAIYLYALNAAGDGRPTLLNNVGDESPSATLSIRNPQPVGELWTVTSPAPGQVSVSGAAIDESDLSQKTTVVITAAGAVAGTLVANQRGPGFEDFPVVFTGTLPSPGGDVTVCATALNVRVGSDQVIGCRQVRVEPLPTPPPPPAPPVVTPPPAEPERITLRLKAVKKKSRLRVDIGPDRDPSNYRFTVQRKAGKKWRTVRRSQTLGPRDRSTIDLRRGKYRVVVPRQHGLAGTRATIRLRR